MDGPLTGLENGDVVYRVAAVSLVAGHLLGVRARNRERFYCPGGQLEEGETPVEALIRELREETQWSGGLGATCLLGRVTASADGRPTGWTVVMDCFLVELPFSMVPSGEIAEVRRIEWSERHILGLASQEAFRLAMKSGGDASP